MQCRTTFAVSVAVMAAIAATNAAGVSLDLDDEDEAPAAVKDLDGFAARASRTQPLKGKLVKGKPVTIVLGDKGRAGVRLVLHKCAKSHFVVGYSDGSKASSVIEVVPTKDGKNEIPDAGIKLAPEIVQFVRPAVTKAYAYGSKGEMTKAYLANWKSVPGAEEHVLDVEVRPSAAGGIDLFVDGSLVDGFREKQGAKGVVAETVTLVLGVGAEYAEKSFAAPESPNFEVVDLRANPRAKAFAGAKKTVLDKTALKKVGVPCDIVQPKDSADVSIARAANTGGGLDVEVYFSRSPLEGFGSAAHWRVPGRQYVKAHLFFALDDDGGKERLMKLRFARYGGWGSGSSTMSEALVDFRDGVRADGLVQVGEVVLASGKKTPLYYLPVALDNRRVNDIAVRRGSLDVELVGGTNGRYPDPKRPSAFSVFGLTLEAMSFDVDFEGEPGNVFTRDEREKSVTAVLTARADGAKATVGWRAKEFGTDAFAVKGVREVAIAKRGGRAEVKMDFSALREEGLYEVDFVCTDGTSKLRMPLRVAVTPPAGRKVATEKSPYGVWWFYGVHDSPDKWTVGGPVMQKAGIRKTYHGTWPKGEYERYDVTFSGFVMAPDPSDEKKFVEEVRKAVDSRPYVDHIMIWHESAPAGGIPHEVLGMEVPPGTDADRKAGDLVNRIGALVRKHFPKLRIQIGNSNTSIGAAFKPLRGGAKPEYYDSIGIEVPSQTFRPEMQRVCGLQGMLIAQEAASWYAKRKVPLAACYEYVYRADCLLGERLQAAWYMRDVVISLMHDMPLISPGLLFDVGNAYYDTLWGYSGVFTRHPWSQPKLAYVAYASLTKALDGVKFVRELDTGSTTVYAPLFVRVDGKFAVALWCARGEGEMVLDAAAGDGEVRTMSGRTRPLKAGGRVAFSEEPAYVVLDREPKGCRIVARTFREGEAAAGGARKAVKTDSAAAFELGPDERIKDLGQWCLPLMLPSGHFSLAEVKDEERGKVLELKLDKSAEKVNKYYTEYTTLRLKRPVAVEKAETIGIRVKGDSNWGQVRFEIEDAEGERFGNWCHTHGERVDMCDWPGLLAVDFDGWAYVWCRFAGGLRDEPGVGLVNAPWFRVAGGATKNGKIDFPIKILSVSFGVNREKLVLKDFVPSAATLRVDGIYVK